MNTVKRALRGAAWGAAAGVALALAMVYVVAWLHLFELRDMEVVAANGGDWHIFKTTAGGLAVLFAHLGAAIGALREAP